MQISVNNFTFMLVTLRKIVTAIVIHFLCCLIIYHSFLLEGDDYKILISKICIRRSNFTIIICRRIAQANIHPNGDHCSYAN
jgi:hypothetical protein